MADNADKQNDIQLNSDNNDKPITDKDMNPVDMTADHKETDEDTQDVKSSDMAIPISSPESESERRCTSASNAGESEYESADDEEVKRVDSFDDAIDGQKEPTEEPTEDSNEEKAIENEPNIPSENVVNNKVSVDSEVKTNQISNEKTEIDSTNTETNCENSTEVSTNVNISQTELQVPQQLSEEINTDITVESNDDKEIKVETIETIDSMEKVDHECDQKELEEDIHISEEGLADDEEEEHDLNEDDEYEDIESDECSDESGDQEDICDKENEELDAEERQQGDGEESNDSQLNQNDKSLDHDEDKRNPQYIPKRGPFYEHDDRAVGEAVEAEGEVVEEVPEDPETTPKAVVIVKKPIETEIIKKKIRKKVWGEGDRWGHDLFREEDQAPKSKDELVCAYGYDIRNEDNPPKARRRRHYGRGPNTYTRKWEDENAYGKGRTSPPIERHEKNTKEPKERTDKIIRNDRSVPKNEINEPFSKEKSGSESKNKEDRKVYDRRENFDRKERPERKDRDQKDKNRMTDRSYRTEKSIESTHKKERFRNEKPLNESRNQRYEYEENVERKERPFSKDDFPELPNNDLRKKLISHQNNTELWKSGQRFNKESDEPVIDYKTEPMKIIDAIEHNNRAIPHNDQNPANVVRTLTFENSKYAQRRSSGNYDLEEERTGSGPRARSKKSAESMENSGRAIKKSNNNLNYQNYGHERKDANDNYRNNRNTNRGERMERGFQSDESNRTVERYYEDDYRNQRDRDSNYIETNVTLQKMSIEDKSQMLNRSNDSEQTRPKRYSSLRQQRVIPENIPTNTQIPQTSDNHNITAHQFYDSHTIQSTAFYAESSAVRPTYHPYMSPTASDAGPPSHPSTYIQPQLPQPIPQRYIPQPNATTPAGEATRYIATAVPPNVVTASVPTPQMAQPLPQPGPVPPPPQPVMSAPAPPPSGYPSGFPSFPSGYPQFPPAPPPTHVPPGYPAHVPAQQPSPHQLAELYRGGVTYYDTQSQQQNAARQVPQRRPKAAIPIVPPPDNYSGEGDGDKSYVSVNS